MHGKFFPAGRNRVSGFHVGDYQHSLDTRFSDEEETHVSEIAHFVFDRFHDVELGLKFFDWLAKQPERYSSRNGYVWSSFLKLLERFRVFSEIELVLNDMKLENVKPTHEALSVVVREYADSGLVDQALDMYYYVIGLYDNCGPDVFAFNSLLALLVNCKKIDVARHCMMKCVKEMVVRIIIVLVLLRFAKGLCKEGKVEEARNLIEERRRLARIVVYVFDELPMRVHRKVVMAKSRGGDKEESAEKYLGLLKLVRIIGYCLESNCNIV
ncbi:hypothetical protein EZV62_000156 [Acer yangbiense]|uniref:Pentacotripeptide-repeat region of PRORP domain-containing protein n=1 Tax=Acer yangbiense TaxID=1000413 RepID=A0A5C7IQB2_9ROSI|nr:hypothetical protein EZV62_000156 [Acer yangbiense]